MLVGDGDTIVHLDSTGRHYNCTGEELAARGIRLVFRRREPRTHQWERSGTSRARRAKCIPRSAQLWLVTGWQGQTRDGLSNGIVSRGGEAVALPLILECTSLGRRT